MDNPSGEKGYGPLAHCVNPTWYAGGLLLFKIERIDIPESEEKRQSQEKQTLVPVPGKKQVKMDVYIVMLIIVQKA